MKYFIAFLLVISSSTIQADELLFPNSDFETGTLKNWTVEGEAFRIQPTRGDNTTARNRETSNLQGKWWIGGYEKFNGKLGRPGETAGDQLTGTLTSKEFTIQHPYISFRIGAGNLPGEVGVRLLLNDQKIDLATGVNSETMVNFSADVKQYKGQTVRLQIFDQARGGWGHINVDDFRGTAEPLPDTSKEFAFTGDISEKAYPDTDYSQPNRPQFHFVSKRNWLNDPNGMVYAGGKYHLFFQHNPLGTEWGNMTWGHATSPDMIHWEQLDHALLPYRVDRRSGTIFSGTAVVDHNNSLGKQVGKTKTICAFYTFAAQPKFYQAMAYSTDNGESWKYWNEGRPVVENQGFDHGERDPKVFWHEQSQQWIMVLWVQQNPGRVRWFTSDNLVDWSFASDLMRDWAFECIDVVFLPVDGNEEDQKCVIYDASFDYEIGTFDGERFHAESETLKNVRGNYYAAQTFNNAPEDRVVQIGWMRGGPNSAKLYDVPHNQQMAFPCEMRLRTTPAGVRLTCWPIEEIQSLVKATNEIKDLQLSPQKNPLADLQDLDLIDLELTFSPGDAEQIRLTLPRVSLRYDAAEHKLFHTGVNNKSEPVEVICLENLAPRDGQIFLRLIVDRLSLEAYAFGGEMFSAHYISPAQSSKTFSLHTDGGQATCHKLTIRELKSAW